MMTIYNLIMQTCVWLLKGASMILSNKPSNKLALFAHGQQQLIDNIQHDMRTNDRKVPVIWFHASSLGEFAVARPLIQKLKQDGPCKIIFTFFSPTGVEALKNHHPFIDYLYYLPLDTRNNACRFIDAVQPDKAVFIISEMWCNYLSVLKERHIPTFLVSAIIRKDSSIMKWHGYLFRKHISAYTHIFVLNNDSRLRLNTLGYYTVTVCGDPLFDNAAIVAQQSWHNAIIERFVQHDNVFIAGSISDNKDLLLMTRLANRHRNNRFLFVPHEIYEEKLHQIKYELRGICKLYSECDDTTDFSSVQVLVIDFLGALPYLYRYAKWAYVGGGFTPFLHSVIEATVYGIPVAYGPYIKRKVTPNQLQELRIGQSINNFAALDAWFSSLKHNDEELRRIKTIAANYVSKNIGATKNIVHIIEQGLWN